MTYALNAAGRFTAAVESANSLTYVTAATYAPHGAPSGLQNGTSVNRRFTYNVRLQPLQIYYTNGALPSASELQGTSCPTTKPTIMGTVYDFGVSTRADNGNVQVIQDCINVSRTPDFHYDSLNRLSDAYTTGQGASIANWGEVYTIDAWGNLTNINKKVGWQNSETLSAATASIKNQLPGFGYDAAGNMRTNSPFTYTYDAENRLVSVINGSSTWTYGYDGDGKRVIKCSGVYPTCTSATLYWTGTSSDPLAETDWAGAALEEYIFFSGKRVARRDGTGNTVHYYFEDHLGSTDVITGTGGAVQKVSVYYPFGGEIAVTAPTFANSYKFTGKERDPESGLDNFGARFDASALARFQTPDPLLSSGRVGSPQTWNRYSYGLNNPLKIVDPTGLYNLPNDCLTNPECKQWAKRLADGLRALKAKVDSMKDSDEKVRLQQALAALGTQNDGNNVDVTFGTLPAGVAGRTYSRSNSVTGEFTHHDVILDPDKIGDNKNDWARDAAHEGTHVRDFSDYRMQMMETAMDSFQQEYRAYQTSAWAAQALGEPTLAFDNGSNVVWDKSWKASDRATKMDRGITDHVKGIPGHPENPIHNPWPDRFPVYVPFD